MFKQQLLKPIFFSCLFLFINVLCYAQNATISGRVTDEKGEGLPGVSVTEKGTTTATSTDGNGSYTIKTTGVNPVLTFKMIGYKSGEVATKNKTTINVRLTDEVQLLNEVVVVGYGTQKRKDVTGSIASVKGDVFKDQPITSVVEALAGRTAGVDVVKGSGAPDATATIVIRGLSSLNQPQPLYIVDGIRMPGDPSINTQDIANIDVLKDASSAAIYGAAAAGGVIVITTKKGRGTTPAVNFNSRYGVSKPRVVGLLNKDEYIRLQNVVNPTFFAGATKLDTLPNTDWVSALYSDANEQNYNLSVSGSSPIVNYLFSGFYNKQDGVYLRNFSNIGGARVNTDYILGKRVKIGQQLAISQRKTAPPIGSEAQLHNAPFRTIPIMPVFNSDGTYGSAPSGYGALKFGGVNPVGAANKADVEDFKNNLQANVYGEIKLPLYLTFRTNFGYSYYNQSMDYFQDAFKFGQVANGANSLTKQSVLSSQVLSNYVLTFDKSFNKHAVNAVAGYEQINGKYNTVNVRASQIGLPGYSFIPTTTTEYNVNGQTDNNGLVKSYFGRLNYNYGGRYYISGSLRQDANFTVFGPNKQKGVFPAASAGWNISEEKFFKSVAPVINALKLRGSYGELGNSNIDPYSFLATYSPFYAGGNGSAGGQNFGPGAPLVLGSSFGAIPNPKLHWETVKETNIGLDGELLSNKLYFTAEWYKKTTKDMLYALPLSLSSGITTNYLTNIGSVESKGIDLMLGYRNKAGVVNYDVSFTAGFNKNKVLSLSGITTDAIYDGYNFYNNGDAGFNIMSNQRITISKAGLPFGSFFGYKSLGIYQTDAEAAAGAQKTTAHAGDLIFEDLNGDGSINQADRQVIGNPNPKMVYGATIRVNAKGFDAAFLFNGVAGVDIFNGKKAYEMFPFQDGSTSPKVFGASFLESNKLTDQPRIGVVNANGSFALDPNKNYQTVNSYFVEKGDYLKLRNVQLGYTFSGNTLQRIKVKNARVFVMANNVFTITKYSGLDPELASSFSQAGYSGVTTKGIDGVTAYPQTRIYSVGLDLNF